MTARISVVEISISCRPHSSDSHEPPPTEGGQPRLSLGHGVHNTDLPCLMPPLVTLSTLDLGLVANMAEFRHRLRTSPIGAAVSGRVSRRDHPVNRRSEIAPVLPMLVMRSRLTEW